MPLTPPSVFRQARNHVAIHTTAAATLLTYSTSSKTGRLNTIREAWRSKEKRAATTGEEGEEGRVETEVEEKDQTNEGLGHYEKCYRERDRSPLSLPLSSPVHISPLKVVMATEEEEYEAFLEKANQDSGAASASAKNGERGDFSSSANNSKQEGKMTVNSAAVPPVLEEVQEYYISDADEPFVPVSLQWKERKLPSADQFRDLIGHPSDVVTQSHSEFDPRGEYTKVVQAVKNAGNGTVVVFKVKHGSTRVEYYVVSQDEKGARLVGLKALAVES